MSFKVKWTVKKSHYDSVLTKALYSPPQYGTTSSFFSSELLLQSHKGLMNSKYRVIVLQKIGISVNCWKLWSGIDDSETAKTAFKAIETTLALILSSESGEICLSEDILSELILPRPLPPDKIFPHVLNVMQSSTPYSQEQLIWLEIMQILLNNVKIVPQDANDRLQFVTDLYANTMRSTMNRALVSVPLVAVPTVTPNNSLEDNEAAQVLWVLFREGALKDLSLTNASVWLIKAIEANHLKCVMNLVLTRFNTNVQLCEGGNTSLHAAVLRGNLSIVKLLLAYEADSSIRNNEGKSPIDLARELSYGQIHAVLQEFSELRKQAMEYNSKHTSVPEKKNTSDSFLLSLDGGGMKSVIMCHILAAIEIRMNELSGGNASISSYFDYIAGTSAGAIIAALLTFNSSICGSTSGIYLFKFMAEVFCSVKKKRSDKLKEYLVDIVGESTVLSDLPKGRNIIVTATVANVSPNRLHLMTNYGGRRENDLPGPNERKVWEALLASSAAPTYFPAFQCFLDGGLMANNPTLVAMTDICNRPKEENDGKESKLGLVLSLGTGYMPPKEIKDFEVYVPSLLSTKAVESLFESSKGLLNLFNHFITETTQSNGESVNQARAWCKTMGAKYYRLSPPLKTDVPPDMNSAELLVDLLYESEKYVLQSHVEIDEVAKIILSK